MPDVVQTSNTHDGGDRLVAPVSVTPGPWDPDVRGGCGVSGRTYLRVRRVP